MAFNRTLEERIKTIQAEIDLFLDAKVEETRKDCEGVPPGVIRQLLTVRAGDCQCRQYLEIRKTET